MNPLPDPQMLYSQLQNFLSLKFILLLKTQSEDFEWEILRVFSFPDAILEISPSFTSQSKFFDEIMRNSNEIYKILGMKPEGTLIKLVDLGSYFTILQVSKFHRNYYYSSCQISHLADAYSVRSLEKTRAGHCYIELSQLDRRYFREKLSYDYTSARLIVAKRLNFLENANDFIAFSENIENQTKKPLNFSYIDGLSGKTRNLSLELFLDPGVYYIVVLLDKNRGAEACLSYYGEEKAKFERENYQGNSGLFGEIMKEVAWKYGRKIELGNGLIVRTYVSLKDGMIVEIFGNENTRKSIEFTRDGKGVTLRKGEERVFLKKLERNKELVEVYKELNEEYLKMVFC